MNCLISYFLKHDLDDFFSLQMHLGEVPSMALNVARAPLSHDLAGVVLPLNSFRNHLNSQNETINEELQMKNFATAGEILAEIPNSDRR